MFHLSWNDFLNTIFYPPQIPTILSNALKIAKCVIHWKSCPIAVSKIGKQSQNILAPKNYLSLIEINCFLE